MVKETIEDYTILNLVGKGAFGNVLIVKRNKNNKLYSMRSINKKDIKVLDNKLLIKGLRPIIELLDFPLIASLDIVFQNKNKLFLLGLYEDKKVLSSYISNLNSLDYQYNTNNSISDNNNKIDLDNSKDVKYNEVNENIISKINSKKEDLTNCIKNREEKGKDISSQIIKAIEKLHSNNIIYRQ